MSQYATALLSPCRRYRYYLWRGDEHVRLNYALFVGLNPSTADETEDDPTIRRCTRFARDWGYDGLMMVNLFAWRATEPDDLRAVEDPVGPENDAWIKRLVVNAGVVVASWGAHEMARLRATKMIASGVLGDYKVLGLTASGAPRHPLYMRASCTPIDP